MDDFLKRIDRDAREQGMKDEAAIYNGDCFFENILVEEYFTSKSKWWSDSKDSRRLTSDIDNEDYKEFQELVEELNDSHEPEIKLDINEFLGVDTETSSTEAKQPKPKVNKDSFEFMKLLGYGTYGRVFLVRKKNNGKIYAIKVLNKENIKKGKQLELTKLERKILKNIKSSFLIKLYYAFQSKTKLFLVLEYWPGGEFYYYLKTLRWFHELTVQFYATNIILGLKALHENGITYRDLKPENLLIDHRGYMKLADFGLAKEKWSPVSGCNTFWGTAEYVAPELIKNKGYGTMWDLWGLGWIIYELLESRPPFYESNQKVMFHKIHNDHLFNQNIKEITKKMLKKYSPDLVDFVIKLLKKDPKQRLGYNGYKEIMDHPWFSNIGKCI